MSHVPAIKEAGAPARRARLRTLARSRPEVVFSPLLLVVVLTAWEYGVRAIGIATYILPVPTEIGRELAESVVSPAVWANVKVTASEALLGFAIALGSALLLGAVVGLAPRIESFVLPYVIAIQTVPTVALAPIFLLWFGFGEGSKIAMAALTAFFPIVINVIDGLRVRSESRIQMLSSFGATRWQVLRMIRLPNALPYVFAGLDIGIVFAILGAVVGEFTGARAGLGYQVLQAGYQFDIPNMFASLVFLAAMGLLAHLAVITVQRRVAFWARKPGQMSG